jgi:hypothetical protein
VQAEELGAGFELVEGAVQVEVGEDASGLLALVGPADQDGVDVHADELQSVEVIEQARHGERQHALARERPCGDAARGLQLVVVELDSDLAKLLCELCAGQGRRVRDEPQPVALLAQSAHRGGRPGDRRA